jgi:hypothetical protein
VPEFSANPGFSSVPVLQELLTAVAAADRLVDAIAGRFEQGDAADDLIGQLSGQVSEIRERADGGDLPDAARDAIGRLVARIGMVTAGGEAWLARTAGEMADTPEARRVRRAYGLPTRGP